MSNETKDNSHNGNYREERSVHELRGEIEETRSELSETIDAIQDKLNPEKVKAQIVQNAKDATIGRALQLTEVAREKAAQLSENAAPIVKNIREIGREKLEKARSQNWPNAFETYPQAHRVLVGTLIGGFALWLIRRK